MMQDRSDPVIDEIREIRQRISARFGHDPARLVAYYIDLQQRHRDELIDVRRFHEPGQPICHKATSRAGGPRPF